MQELTVLTCACVCVCMCACMCMAHTFQAVVCFFAGLKFVCLYCLSCRDLGVAGREFCQCLDSVISGVVLSLVESSRQFILR